MNVIFYNTIIFILKIILFPFFYPKIKGVENIPKDGPLVICSNHGSLLDPIFLALYTHRPIHFMGKKELFENKFLNFIFSKLGAYPIDRGETDLKALRASINILKNDSVLGIFPEGTRVVDININNFKDGVSMIATRGKSNILPVRIKSNYKPFSRVILEYKKPIIIEDLMNNLSRKEANEKITKAIFESIYEEEIKGLYGDNYQ